MTWGLQDWGLSGYGGWAVPGAGPFLVDSNPGAGEQGVATNATVAFIVDSTAGIDPSFLSVTVDGIAVVSGGVFVGGFTGSIVNLGPTSPTAYLVTITTHTPFDLLSSVDVAIDATDLATQQAWLSFNFKIGVAVGVADLLAKTHCDGKRVDLSWSSVASAATRMIIMRSKYNFPKRVTDPGDTLYDGVPIAGFVDGVYTGSLPTSNAALEPDKVYYYSIFLTFDGSAPYYYRTNDSMQVAGLSIKDYYAEEGDYVYRLLPVVYRQRDEDEGRGDSRYLLKKYCRVIQCSINLYRGYATAFARIKDPEQGPAGVIGVPSNQLSLLTAFTEDLGFKAERSFDSGVLRRIALGIVSVRKKKGTCPGLVSFVKLFSSWDSRCDELIEPACGVNRLATTWDGVSYMLQAQDTGAVAASGTGLTYGTAEGLLVDLPTNEVSDMSGVLAHVPITGLAPPLSFIIDAMGTWACVTSVEDLGTGERVTLKKGWLRANITGTGTNLGGNLWQIDAVDNARKPWQYASGAGTGTLKWGKNAWAGYKIRINGSTYSVISSEETDSLDQTVLTLNANPGFSGAYNLAKSFNGATPLFSAKLYVGQFSLIFDPRWDYRLLAEPDGPFSVLTSLGGTSGFSATPADVIMWVKGIGPGEPAEVAQASTGMTVNTITDSTAAWTVNQWVGYYVNPNWEQGKVYKILANTATLLFVKAPDEGITAVASAGSVYVILGEENAIKYTRLISLLPQFLPFESRGFIKFEA